MSSNCVVIGGEMLSYMNLSVDRCNDFYSYACQSFINDVTIPPSSLQFSTLNGIIMKRKVARLQKVSANLLCNLLCGTISILRNAKLYCFCHLRTPNNVITVLKTPLNYINTKTLQFNKYCKGLPVKASKQQKSFWG